jgi:hypothetical protein
MRRPDVADTRRAMLAKVFTSGAGAAPNAVYFLVED